MYPEDRKVGVYWRGSIKVEWTVRNQYKDYQNETCITRKLERREYRIDF